MNGYYLINPLLRSYFVLCCSIIVTLLSFTKTYAETLTLGVVPQQSASKLAQRWWPIAEYLSKHSDLDIRFVTAPNIPEFERRLSVGTYSIAYMNPYHYVAFNEISGYRAIAHAKDKRIRGIIVKRKGSAIHSLEDLNNKNVAFPAPAAFAASILTRSKLNSIPVEFNPNYVSSHDSVYRSVGLGLFEAGGGIIRTFDTLDPEIRSNLEILWVSNSYTPHAIAVHPDIKLDLIEKLRQALSEMHLNIEGQIMLKSLSINGFKSAVDSDWDDVRSLNIDLIDGYNPL